MTVEMENLRFLVFLFLILGCHVFTAQSQGCILKTQLASEMSASYRQYNKEDICWDIRVPQNSFISLKVTQITSQSCSISKLKITVAGTGDVYTFCDSSSVPLTVLSDVNVLYSHLQNSYKYPSSSFKLEYVIKNIECASKDSFKCSEHSCIPKSKVCDGVKDCENGADELKCETGVLAVVGVEEARNSSVSWLKNNKNAFWGWKEATSRAVMALYLAGDANFNGTNVEEELMAKQTELNTAVALLRPSITNSELSMFVNALLVTCHNPRRFYGINLVKRLKAQVEVTESFTYPVAYLALCNANESWPLKATTDLTNILQSGSEYPFIEDLQAMAMMAISCMINHSKDFSYSHRFNGSNLYNETIKRFKGLQQQDGSFGNVYTTALITQALISSGQEHARDWKLSATVKYLMKELNDSSVDFLSTHLSLPILNGKSLIDIATVNCSANPRKHGDDPISEIKDYIGPKMRIQYSLFVGDERDVIHTISLRVPENYTAFEVMELAQVEDPKYKFEWKKISEKIYVYQIARVTNDPEDQKFWLLFVGSANSSESVQHLTASPDKVILEEGQHLIMWYKTAQI